MLSERGITVIVPTIGRGSLTATIESFADQLGPEDAVVVVAEPEANSRRVIEDYARWYPGPDWSYLPHKGGAWGHPNRNYVLDCYVETSHVWTLDDDDVATPGALDALRAHMDDPWTIFKMRYGDNHLARGTICWRWRRIMHGDIGTPMLFAPLGESRFSEYYSGDLSYAHDLQKEHGEPVWAEDVVAVIRP